MQYLGYEFVTFHTCQNFHCFLDLNLILLEFLRHASLSHISLVSTVTFILFESVCLILVEIGARLVDYYLYSIVVCTKKEVGMNCFHALIKPRGPRMLDKHSSSELHFQPWKNLRKNYHYRNHWCKWKNTMNDLYFVKVERLKSYLD